jgi:3-dehydroquinate synthase
VSIEPLSFTIGGTRSEVVFQDDFASLGAAVTVFDATTASLFGDGAANPVILAPGEGEKRWESVSAILERCAGAALGRDSMIAGVGGGVVCDLTAFAASLYMRGCGLLLAPTTLLAMVDASLGGKTGIDFLGYKNLVGTFYPASRIVICAPALRTLPQREYLSGLAEVIKTAIIGDAELFSLLESRHADVMARAPDTVEEMIRRCLVVKGRIVESDPKENGTRALLNLGHTFGHALETATGFQGWTHGEAVAWGIGRALIAGSLIGITDPAFAKRVTALLRLYGYRLSAPAPAEALLPAMNRDKKRSAGRIRLVVPRQMCDTQVRESTPHDIAAVLAHDEI